MDCTSRPWQPLCISAHSLVTFPRPPTARGALSWSTAGEGGRWPSLSQKGALRRSLGAEEVAGQGGGMQMLAHHPSPGSDTNSDLFCLPLLCCNAGTCDTGASSGERAVLALSHHAPTAPRPRRAAARPSSAPFSRSGPSMPSYRTRSAVVVKHWSSSGPGQERGWGRAILLCVHLLPHLIWVVVTPGASSPILICPCH